MGSKAKRRREVEGAATPWGREPFHEGQNAGCRFPAALILGRIGNDGFGKVRYLRCATFLVAAAYRNYASFTGMRKPRSRTSHEAVGMATPDKPSGNGSRIRFI